MPISDKCDICDNRVQDDQDGLLCDKCNAWKHRVCMTMSNRIYTQISKSNEPWFCGNCKNDKKKQPTRNYTINDVMEKLEEMNDKYNALFAKFQEQLLVNEKQQTINEKLTSELKEIKEQLNKKEQIELKNNIVIQGIPYKQNEDLQEIVNKVVETLDAPLGKYNAYRLGKRGEQNGAIKVIFEDGNVKKQIIKSKKKVNLQCRDIGYKNVNNKIFINHDLTKTNLELFKEAKKYKINNNFKYLWVDGGNILLRKDENSKAIAIQSTEQLKN